MMDMILSAPPAPAIQHQGETPLALVLDDDTKVRTVAALLLNSVGIETVAFGSAQEVLNHGEPERPCCLLSDVRLPGMSWLDLQTLLAERGSLMPVIFMSEIGRAHV